MANIPGKPASPEVVIGTDGLFNQKSGLRIMAYAVPKEDSIMPITDETFEARTTAFKTALEERDGIGKLVTGVTGQRLVQVYGEDVIQAALDDGLIGIG